MTAPPDDVPEAAWITGCYGADIGDGDLIDIDGERYRVVSRSHSPVWNPTVLITLPDMSTVAVFKSTPLRIFDPDGTVRARVQAEREHRP